MSARVGQEDGSFSLLVVDTPTAMHRRRAEADCRHCGKAEGDSCPACGGVNAVAGADKKRRAREESERARTEGSAPGSSTTPTAVESAPRGDAQRTEENP